jgi:hypothetical protein
MLCIFTCLHVAPGCGCAAGLMKTQPNTIVHFIPDYVACAECPSEAVAWWSWRLLILISRWRIGYEYHESTYVKSQEPLQPHAVRESP